MTDQATRDHVRLLIGDTDSTRPLLDDAELDTIIDARTNDVYKSAADACDALAAKFAREVDSFSADQDSVDLSERAERYRKQAITFRVQADGGWD